MALETISKEASNVRTFTTLRIMRPWDPEDGNLTWKFNKQMSDAGLCLYWEAFDRVFMFFTSKIDEENKEKVTSKIRQKIVEEKPYHQPIFDRYNSRYDKNYHKIDRYHYTRRPREDKRL